MIIKLGNETAKLPDFMIVGAPKCGTTSLYYYLRQHPQIYMPEVKEPHFFCFMNDPPDFKSPAKPYDHITKVNDYNNIFKEAGNNQIIGEATPAYLYKYNKSIDNIKRIYRAKIKKVKIIIILRNPVERAFSQYMMFRRDLTEPLDFEKAIIPGVIKDRLSNNWNFYYDYVGFGMYFQQVQAYLEAFPSVKIVLYEDFKKDNLNILREIFNFLDVDQGFIPNMGINYNPSGRLKFVWLHEFLFKKSHFLKDIFRGFIPYETRMKIKYIVLSKNVIKEYLPENIKKHLILKYNNNILALQELIGKDLSVWKK